MGKSTISYYGTLFHIKAISNSAFAMDQQQFAMEKEQKSGLRL